MLADFKKYLYNLCCTGQLYPSFYRQMKTKAREDFIVANHVARAVATGFQKPNELPTAADEAEYI